MNGAGEMLTYSAADFEDFVEPRPDLAPHARNRPPARRQAPRGKSLALPAPCDLRRVDRPVPRHLRGGEPGRSRSTALHWFFDHAETVTDRNLERIKALGGGIAVQHRMAYQGEAFVDRYGAARGRTGPPQSPGCWEMGVPVAGGTDATRVASYNPWVCLHWLVTGGDRRGPFPLPRGEPGWAGSRRCGSGPTAARWFSNEDGGRGTLRAGEPADLAVLTEDYFSVPEGRIKGIESLLTLMDGKVVHAEGPFAGHAPPPLPVRPDWSPVGVYGGYHRAAARPGGGGPAVRGAFHRHLFGCPEPGAGPFGGGCGCWAF